MAEDNRPPVFPLSSKLPYVTNNYQANILEAQPGKFLPGLHMNLQWSWKPDEVN